MKTCVNCYWADRCHDAGSRCEYYDPLFSSDSVAVREYRHDLKERGKEYAELIKDQQDIDEDLY